MAVITIASHKGGVGKSTLAFHLAAVLSFLDDSEGQVLVIDGDENRSVLGWASKNETDSLPFKVVTLATQAKWFQAGNRATHIIVDTQARPSRDDLREIIGDSDLLIIPTPAQSLSIDTLPLFLADLRALGVTTPYTFLLTLVDSRTKDAVAAREYLRSMNVPLLDGQIRLFNAFQKAADQGVLVRDARAENGKRDRNAGVAWNDCMGVGKEVWEIIEQMKEEPNG
ncbi:ParA family protein [Nodosilinea nodulosa]|uniref:ParA family protein n=1 Tax=Nodosilinea nodulosa TaxID=416001 RepID=UPI0002E120D7|nr:ParA family protein [Nodosilinea nodulosa]